MAGSGTDWDPGIGTGQERNLDWNWTGESDRCDRTRRGSRKLELIFLSRIDVIGLVVDPET